MVGCPISNSLDIIECLRSRPGKIIAETVFQFMVNIDKKIIVQLPYILCIVQPWRFNPFSPFGPTVETVGNEPFLPDIPEKLIAHDIPVLMSITQNEGFIIAVFILFEDAMNEINNNWNEYIPHLLDYNYTISNENLRTKIAQDIKQFYFGDQKISMETKSNLIKVRFDINICQEYLLDIIKIKLLNLIF